MMGDGAMAADSGAIKGYIVYRLQLQPLYSTESNNNSPSRRKRPRTKTTDGHDRQQQKRQQESQQPSSSTGPPCWRSAGYYLIVQQAQQQQHQRSNHRCHHYYKEYLLSLPLQYVQQIMTTMISSSETAMTTTITTTSTPAGDAPSITQEDKDYFCCHVRILDYTVVSFVIDTTKTTTAKAAAKAAASATNVINQHQDDIALLQVHHMEVVVVPPSLSLSQQQQENDQEEEEEKKESDSQETLRSNSTTTSFSSVQYYSQPLTVEELEREQEAHRQRQQRQRRRRQLDNEIERDNCSDGAPPVLSLSQLKYQERLDQQRELRSSHNNNNNNNATDMTTTLTTPKTKNNKRKRQQEEVVEPHTQPNNTNNTPKKKQYYNIIATVDSISPIIAMDPTDPFALMEMYDDCDSSSSNTNTNNNPDTVVVVLKGREALKYHDGIQPGQKLLLQNVQRKSWPIVDAIRNYSGQKKKNNNENDNNDNSTRLLNRIPSYVLVVSNSNQTLRISTTNNNTIISSPQLLSSLLQLPPLPSTPVPLISIRGTIVNVEHIWLPSPSVSAVATGQAVAAKHSRHKVSTLHWIEIEPLLVLPHQTTVEESMTTAKKNGIRYRLYLTHYPLSPSNQLCLAQIGTIVQAINVHVLDCSCSSMAGSHNASAVTSTIFLGTCLRSTVSLLQHSSYSGGKSNMATPMKSNNNKPSALLQVTVDNVMPFCFTKIRRTYREYILLERVTNFLLSSNSSSLLMVDTGDDNTKVQSLVNHLSTSLFNYSSCGTSITTSNRLSENSTIAKKTPRRRQRRRRNPYAEFFDHAIDDDDDSAVEYHDVDNASHSITRNAAAGSDNYCGCDMSRLEYQHEEEHKNMLPNLMQLETIRHVGVRMLMKRLNESYFQQGQTKPRAGWTGSIHVAAEELWENFQDTTNVIPLKSKLFTGGVIVPSMISDDKRRQQQHQPELSILSKCFAIRDEQCQIPASFVPHIHCDFADGNVPQECNVNPGEFVMVSLETVIVSFLCVGSVKSTVEMDKCDDWLEEEKKSEIILPPFENPHKKIRRDKIIQQLRGSCVVVTANGYLFIISVQCQLSFPIIRGSEAVDKSSNGTRAAAPACQPRKEETSASFRTIQDLLDAPNLANEYAPGLQARSSVNHEVLRGLLVRQGYRFAKVQANGRCASCVFTLAHVPTEGVSSADALKDAASQNEGPTSMLQSLEAKAAVSCTHEMNALVMSMLSKLDSAVLDDQVALILSWWSVADCSRSCAMVAGGWDEFCDGGRNPCSTSSHVLVEVPLTAVRLAPRGYVRVVCHLEEVDAWFASTAGAMVGGIRSSWSHSTCLNGSNGLDFCGGARRILPGILDRRPSRKIVKVDVTSIMEERIIGELSSPAVLDGRNGVATAKLVDLFRWLCCDLRLPESRYHLAPSLVRRIAGARFLGVLSCQAQCKCTRCFKRLVSMSSVPSKKEGNDNSRRGQNLGFVNEPSFWHLPLPIPGHEGQKLPSREDVKAIRRNSSNLRCPNGCPVECYAVEWECGGILDDGTGQARLNASREAALTILGMSSYAIEAIEEGVWTTQEGIVSFLNAKKPPPYLQPCIQAAISRTRNSGNRQPTPEEVLKYLTPEARAEYLMYSHCRASARPRRPLDYFVRCRPLSDTVEQLNQTEAKIFLPKGDDDSGGAIVATGMPTYALPPLKLDLVDCSVPSYEGIGYYPL